MRDFISKIRKESAFSSSELEFSRMDLAFAGTHPAFAE